MVYGLFEKRVKAVRQQIDGCRPEYYLQHNLHAASFIQQNCVESYCMKAADGRTYQTCAAKTRGQGGGACVTDMKRSPVHSHGFVCILKSFSYGHISILFVGKQDSSQWQKTISFITTTTWQKCNELKDKEIAMSAYIVSSYMLLSTRQDFVTKFELQIYVTMK